MPANSAVLELPPKGAGFLPKSPKDGGGIRRIDMTCRTVYFNGEFVSEQEPGLHFRFGAHVRGHVFDMTRTYGQKPFRLKEHLERIYAGLKYLEIDCGLTLEEMERATLETLERNLPVVDGADVRSCTTSPEDPCPCTRACSEEPFNPPFPSTAGPCGGTWPTTAPVPLGCPLGDRPPEIGACLPDRAQGQEQKPGLLPDGQPPGPQGGPPRLPSVDGRSRFITEGSGSNFFIVRQGGCSPPRATIFWWACRATLSWTC